MVAFYSPLSHCHNMVTFIYHLNRRILQLGYLKPSLPQDPKAVLNCYLPWMSSFSLKSAGGCLLEGLNFLAPKLISNLLGANNPGWDFFREVRAARMAVAARQRREEKVCSSTKPFLEGKQYERLFLDGKWYKIWSFRWNLKGYRLATPSSTSPSLHTHSRLACLSMEKWPNEV